MTVALSKKYGKPETSGDGRTKIKRPSIDARPIGAELLEQEVKWRSWFPKTAVLDDRRQLPADEVDILLNAFEKFCRECILIKVPGKRIPFELRDAQRETVRDWITHRHTIALKARQIGFSTLSAVFALWLVLGGSDRQIYMLSKGEREAISLMSKARYAYRSMPEWVRKRGPRLIDRKVGAMTFDNDSFIVSAPSAADPIRGETAYMVFVDEWASLPNPDDAWASIEPVADIGGRIIGLSTAKGEGTFFHQMWVKAETKSSTFHPIFHPWWAVPERDDDWYEERCRNMEPWQRYQEYPSNPEEAFIGSGNPFFDLEILRDMKLREPKWTYQIELDKGVVKLTEGGDLKVWEKPDRRKAYVIGADVAQGLEHGDWSVAYVMDAESGDIVAMYRGKPAPHYYGSSILPAMGIWYGHAIIAPEVNNHGHTTVKALQLAKYKRIYRRRTQLRRQESPTETIGWLTTHGNKATIMDGVSEWIRTHDVPDAGTLAELKTFVREQKGERVKLHGSPHDDCVMALGITIACRKYAVENNLTKVKASDVPGSIKWWENQLAKQKGGDRRRLRPVF